MFKKTKELAPEPYLHAALVGLHWFWLKVRSWDDNLPDDQLVDMSKAVLSVPESLLEWSTPHTDKEIFQEFLAPYDRKWSGKLIEMFSNPFGDSYWSQKSLALEPYLSGALYLLQEATRYLVENAEGLPPKKRFRLADAMENVPESIYQSQRYFSERNIREVYLPIYDKECVHSKYDLRLHRTLDSGIELAKVRDEAFRKEA